MFPGSGITPFTINELQFVWWEIYFADAQKLDAAARKRVTEHRRAARQR